MARILMLYSTTDGHTLQICQRLQRSIEHAGHQVVVLPVVEAPDIDLALFDKIVIGASIRYGRHSQVVHDFIRRNRAVLESRPNAFFSVNVVARKPGKDQPESNPYLQKFLRRISWRPRELAVFAGKIDYPRYGFLDRMMIRLIMWMTHGPTDPRAVVEFTDWGRVEEFARVVSRM